MHRLRAGLALAAVLLGALEAVCRIFPAPTMVAPPPRSDGGDTMMSGSPWLLWELVPGEHLERGGHVSINSRGLRDRERGAKSRPRAIATGDSSVYGFGNDDDEVFTSILESRINADFVNAAVPGYSTYQSLNLLRGRVMALQPDLLLVANLWSDNNFDAFSDRDLLAAYDTWELSETGRLRSALGASSLFQRLDWWIRVKPAGVRVRNVGWQAGGTTERSGNRRVALGDYARNLEAMCDLMVTAQGGVAYILLSNREDIEPVSASPAWNPYREAMKTAAARCRAPLVDIPAAFTASGRSADALFLDQMHPTALGHTLMANAVEAVLNAQGWPVSRMLAAPSSAPLGTPIDPFEGHGTMLEATQNRGLDIQLDVRDAPNPPEGVLIVAVRAPDGQGAALGSQALETPGIVRVSVSERPAQVVISVTRDTAKDGPNEGDLTANIGPLVLPGNGPLVVDLSAADWK